MLFQKDKTAKERAIYGLKMVIGPFAICFALEMLYRNSLYEASLVDQPKMQKHKKLHNFFTLISEGAEWYVHLIGGALMFNLVPKASALYIYTSYYCMDFMKNLLKSWYGEPRPFWISNEITTPKCQTGFGNPSGHMFSTVFILITLFLHKYQEIGVV